MPVTCGVPQGSVGGPTLFSIYLSGIKSILQRHSVKYHCYADDIQLYVSFPPSQSQALCSIHNLESCVEDICSWLSLYSLKLNCAKSEFLLFGSKVQLDKINVTSFKIADSVIPLSHSCRNLGITFDCTMSMSAHISNMCKSVRYQLRNVGLIRKYLTRPATEKIVHALISSRLDFGNGLLFHLPQTQLSKLQKLQNAAARIVTLTRKHTHITPVLKSLHWLPVESRITLKLLLLIFHCINGSAPIYNISLVKAYTPVRSLRSSNTCMLQVTKSSKSWGDRSFSHAGPTLWNDLPLQIRNISNLNIFKIKLKTTLFNLAYV